MKIDMFGASSEAIAASVLSAAVLLGAALGTAPEPALAGSAGDTDLGTALGGARYLALTSDAMAPSIPRGALLVADLSDDIRVGDIVTVPLTGGLVTRRVVGSDTIEGGRLLTLQADASAAPEDVGVMLSGQATVVHAYVPYAGYLAEGASRWGRAALLLASLVLFALVLAARWRMRKPVPMAPELAPVPIASAT